VKYPGEKIAPIGKRVYRDFIVEDNEALEKVLVAGEPDWHHFEQSDFSLPAKGVRLDHAAQNGYD
jgi:hypothetical protein